MTKQLLAAILGAAIALAGMAAGARHVASLTPQEPAPIQTLGGFSPQPIVTLQNAITETANGSSILMSGYQMATFHVEGVTTATLTFEGTVDGTNWIALAVADLNDTSRTKATTATADGLYLLEPAGGLSQVRTRISAYTAGTITVKARGY